MQLLARILGWLSLQPCSSFSLSYAICLFSTLFFLSLFSRHATAACQPFPATPCRGLAFSQGALASVRAQLPATAWAPELVLSLKISTMHCWTWIVFFRVSERGNNHQCVRGLVETIACQATSFIYCKVVEPKSRKPFRRRNTFWKDFNIYIYHFIS